MLQDNQIEKIEQYHSGNMSSEDVVAFEKELVSNPALKSESDFQSDIISGIKEYRRTQLKSRLNGIDVSSGWMEFARQSSLIKTFGGIALATLIGSGVYFLVDKESKEVVNLDLASKIEVNGPEKEERPFVWAVPINDSTTKTNSIGSESIEPVNERSETVVLNQAQIQPSESLIMTDVSKGNPYEAVFSPKFVVPEAGAVFEDEDLTSSGLDKVPTVSETDSSNEQPIEVETKNSKNAKIHYKYYDGKLFLNGDFNKEPYEILEINSTNSRRIYLLHQNKYFEVKTTDRLTELPEITNIKLIQELRLIKENK